MGTGQTTGLSLYNARPVHGAYIRLKPGHRARLMLVLGVATILGILLALCGPELVQHLLNNGVSIATYTKEPRGFPAEGLCIG